MEFPLNIAFVTSTPLDVSHGSGTYVGLETLARALRETGASVDCIAPPRRRAPYTAQRLWFNEVMRRRDWSRYDLVVGYDMDGYRLRVPHVAAIKGVIADEMQFESGATRLLLALQARCEKINAQRASLVITSSQYSAQRLLELYSLRTLPTVVPEPIDLARWAELFGQQHRVRDESKFTVLTVARFYRRKRIDVLLKAAAQIPELEFRIVGDGPEAPRLRALAPSNVTMLGTVSRSALAAEYTRASAFCLASVQEGFGIVLLEAMAAGLPIVAARAAAAPEVAPHAILVEPDSAEALASGLLALFRNPARTLEIAEAGRQRVRQYDAPVVARKFLAAVAGVAVTQLT